MNMEMIDGVCCQYCVHFDKGDCPVKTASPWSRWGNWCNCYRPNPNIPEARELVATTQVKMPRKGDFPENPKSVRLGFIENILSLGIITKEQRDLYVEQLNGGEEQEAAEMITDKMIAMR